MNIVSIRQEEKWNVLYMGKLEGVCRKCQWREIRMVNPNNQGDIEEIKRLIRVEHATKTKCPFDVSVL